jgi:ParB family chromosome partitioning protein
MANKKGGLGRGIGALIPTPEAGAARPVDVFFGGATPKVEGQNLVQVPGASFAVLDLDQIQPNHNQPRTEFEPAAMEELVHSIREFGVLQPIVVRSLPNESGKYELIMGERRWRASRLAGKTNIPVVIRETSDENMLRDALLENLHRSDLNPEEASAYQQLMADFGITQEVLSAKIGRSRPQISNTIRLLTLPKAIQLKVAGGALSAGQARAILAAKTEERMQHWANKAINENLTVRNLEEQIAIDVEGAKPKGGTIKPGGRQDALKELAQRLGDALDTKAHIKLTAKKGEIKIEFATMQDLFRILDKFGIERNL